MPPDVQTIHIIAAVVVSMAGASFSVLDKRTTLGDSSWHIGLAGFLGGLGFTTCHGVWQAVVWYVWLLPLGIGGFSIYGIAAALKKGSSKVSDVDLLAEIQKRLPGGQK